MGDPLDRLTIRGFKSIRALEDFPFRALNVCIGANGAGKSNLIECFRLLRHVVDGSYQEVIREGGGISDFLFNGRKVTPHLEFEMRFGDRGYRFKINPGPAESCTLADEACYSDTNSQWWEPGNCADGQSLLVQEATGTSQDRQYCKPVYSAISSWQIYHFHDTGATAAMRGYEIIQDNKALREDAANIAPYLLRLKSDHPASYQDIVESVRLVMPFFADFLLDVTAFGDRQKVNLSWRQSGSDYPMQPYHLSDGALRFICLATALLQPDPPSTLIIDEPELGLHPLAISVLAEMMQSAANGAQLIVATQSPALIDHCDVEDIIVVSRKDGASTFERLQEQDFNVWLETYSVGELWRKNVIAGGPVYE